MTERTISLPMLRALYQLAQSPSGWLPERKLSAKSTRALHRRGLVRNALSDIGREAGICLTVTGREYVRLHWPACPMLLDREPAEGWTPEEGVGW